MEVRFVRPGKASGLLETIAFLVRSFAARTRNLGSNSIVRFPYRSLPRCLLCNDPKFATFDEIRSERIKQGDCVSSPLMYRSMKCPARLPELRRIRQKGGRKLSSLRVANTEYVFQADQKQLLATDC